MKNELDNFFRNRVRPAINTAVADASSVVFVDLWNTFQFADRKTIWYGGQLYWCHKERVEEGGIISDEWVQDFMPLRTDTIYVDKSNDIAYRWDGSDMIPLHGPIDIVVTDQATYDGMSSYDPNTLYIIPET